MICKVANYKEQIEKTALNAVKARQMAKEVGVVAQGNWKWALRNLRGKRGELLKGRELAEAKAQLGSVPNNFFQKITSAANRMGGKNEIGLAINKGDKLPPRFRPGRSYHTKQRLLQRHKLNYDTGKELEDLALDINAYGHTKEVQGKMFKFLDKHHDATDFRNWIIDNADNPKALYNNAGHHMEKYLQAQKINMKGRFGVADKLFIGESGGVYTPKDRQLIAHTHPATERIDDLRILKRLQALKRKGTVSAEDVGELNNRLHDQEALVKNIVTPSGLKHKFDGADVINMTPGKTESIISPEKKLEGVHTLRPKGVRSIYFDRAPKKK